MPPKDEQYQLGDDGLVVEKVGAWAKTKHKHLTDYIQASGGARSNYNQRSGAAEWSCLRAGPLQEGAASAGASTRAHDVYPPLRPFA